MTEKKYLKLLGERILEKREALGLSREELAEKVELTRMHIYRIENGENPTTILVLRRIAKTFGISPNELISNIE